MIAGAVLWNANPLVLTVDGFAEPAECDAAIRAAGGGLTRAPVLDGPAEARTNTRATIDHRKDGWLNGLCLKVANLLRLSAAHAEPMNVLNYQPGEQFHPHSDGFDLDDPAAADELAHGGQRVFSAIVYLNEVTAGGATAFPAMEMEVAPAPGRLLVFANCWAGSRDLCSHAVHAGTPVTEGEKWAATLWWRERPAAFDAILAARA